MFVGICPTTGPGAADSILRPGTDNSPGPKLCADVPGRGSVTLDQHDIHLLSNHLAVIIGFVELMIADAAPDDPHFNDLMDVRAAAIAAANLIGRAATPET
jgi:hypothetical protein